MAILYNLLAHAASKFLISLGIWPLYGSNMAHESPPNDSAVFIQLTVVTVSHTDSHVTSTLLHARNTPYLWLHIMHPQNNFQEDP